MKGFLQAFGAVVLFFVLSIVSVFLIGPLVATEDVSASLGQPAASRVPVLLVVQKEGSKSFLVTQLRNLDENRRKHPGHSFLLPAGSNQVVDQDGDRASYTAREMRPGRQFVQLKASVGDYVYEVEYEAEATSVFPVRAKLEDNKKAAILAFPVGLLLTWLVMRFARSRARIASRERIESSRTK
jgi:hypothetical protein